MENKDKEIQSLGASFEVIEDAPKPEAAEIEQVSVEPGTSLGVWEFKPHGRILRGDAPVPPSKPEIVTWSARALETPAATVPTPIAAPNFTLMRASGFAFLRS